MSEKRTRRGLLVGALGLAAARVLSACGGASQHADGGEHVHDNANGANVDVSDYLPNAGLAELSDASELVVSGRVVGAVGGVQIGENKDLEYTIYTIAVDEVVKGSAGESVEVALLTHIQRAPVVFDSRSTPKRGDRGIWLLTKIAPEFKRDGYVLTNQNSQLLVKPDGSGLTGGASSSLVAKEVKELGSLAGVLHRLRDAAR